MFIRVKYGDDETMLCNVNCVVVNLLSSIRTRSGHANSQIAVDLTDETGPFYARCAAVSCAILHATRCNNCRLSSVLESPACSTIAHRTTALLRHRGKGAKYFDEYACLP